MLDAPSPKVCLGGAHSRVIAIAKEIAGQRRDDEEPPAAAAPIPGGPDKPSPLSAESKENTNA